MLSTRRDHSAVDRRDPVTARTDRHWWFPAGVPLSPARWTRPLDIACGTVVLSEIRVRHTQQTRRKLFIMDKFAQNNTVRNYSVFVDSEYV